MTQPATASQTFWEQSFSFIKMITLLQIIAPGKEMEMQGKAHKIFLL